MEPSGLVIGAGLLAAFVVGLSKTAVPAAGVFAVALLATVLPPLPSTGVALPVLILGDVFAIALYARHADVAVLVRLLPSVTVGLVAGYTLVRLADADVVARVIGLVLLLSVAGAVLRRRRGEPRPGGASGPVSQLLGAGAGLATMVANAGGPMMSLYLLRMRVTVLGFMGTVAWFFFVLNVLKVPFSVGLGLITPQSLVLSAAIAPGVVAGALLGRRLVRRMSAEAFATVALVATTAAGVGLIVR